MDNNPIAKIDPDGRSTHTDSSGNVIHVSNDGNKNIFQHKSITNQNQVKAFQDYYNKNNKSNDEGSVVGKTVLWNSFTDDAGRAVGKINFGSFDGMQWIGESSTYLMRLKGFDGKPASDEFRLVFYAGNAGAFQMFDYKRGGMTEAEFKKLSPDEQQRISWAGSQLSPGLYASARDYGNYMAGVAARMSHRDYKEFLQIAGSFNATKPHYGSFGLELILGAHRVKRVAPAYGEAFNSNFFQRLGYNLIKTETQLKNASGSLYRDMKK